VAVAPQGTKPPDIQPGEQVLKAGFARAYRAIRVRQPGRLKAYWKADGRLLLTDRRLLWRRTILTLPFAGVQPFEIPLRTITRCYATGSELSSALAFGGGLWLEVGEDTYRFLVVKQRWWPPAWWFSREAAEEWRDAVEAATPHAE
jgi:hypothetical protein